MSSTRTTSLGGVWLLIGIPLAVLMFYLGIQFNKAIHPTPDKTPPHFPREIVKLRTPFANFPTRNGIITSLSFTPDGELLIASGPELIVCDPGAGSVSRRLSPIPAESIYFVTSLMTPKRSAILETSNDGIYRVDLLDGSIQANARIAGINKFGIDVESSAALIAVSRYPMYGKPIALNYDLASLDQSVIIPQEAQFARFEPGGKRLISICTDARIRITDTKTGMVAMLFPKPNEANVIALSANNRWLVAADSGGGRIRVYWRGFHDLMVPVVDRMEKGVLTQLTFVRNDRYLLYSVLYTNSQQGNLVFFDLESGKRSAFSDLVKGPVLNAAVSVDSQYLAVSGYDGDCRVYRVQDLIGENE